jgi:hypothetical protein
MLDLIEQKIAHFANEVASIAQAKIDDVDSKYTFALSIKVLFLYIRNTIVWIIKFILFKCRATSYVKGCRAISKTN